MIKELNYKDVYLIPRKANVWSRSECDTSVKLGNYTFKMPIYPANMKSVVSEETCKFLAENGWFYTMHRFGVDAVDFIHSMHYEDQISSISIGVKPESHSLLHTLRRSNICPDYVTIDVANAWSSMTENVTRLVKHLFPLTFLIVGNVATSEAVKEIQEWGADAIKVGIAGGNVCITKDKTGFHRPMISTIQDCVSVAKVPIIADGGIETHGDIAKALACGATMVMAGKLFAGYDESAGNVIEINDRQYKEYYGSASAYNKDEKNHIEGKKILVDYKGSMGKLLKELKEDLQSSISYAGGKKVSDLMLAQMVEI